MVSLPTAAAPPAWPPRSAAARRLATSAEVGGRAHGAIEGSRADDVDEAWRIGTALGAKVKQFCRAQGWVA